MLNYRNITTCYYTIKQIITTDFNTKSLRKKNETLKQTTVHFTLLLLRKLQQ